MFSVCPSGHSSPPTQNICITFMQCWTNGDEVELLLYKCYTVVIRYSKIGGVQ